MDLPIKNGWIFPVRYVNVYQRHTQVPGIDVVGSYHTKTRELYIYILWYTNIYTYIYTHMKNNYIYYNHFIYNHIIYIYSYYIYNHVIYMIILYIWSYYIYRIFTLGLFQSVINHLLTGVRIHVGNRISIFLRINKSQKNRGVKQESALWQS